MSHQLTLDEALALAAERHNAGNLGDAELIYRQILAHDPRHARATLGLGALAAQAGRYDEAMKLVQRAMALDPQDAGIPAAMGNLCMMQARLHEAIAAYVRALSIRPDMAEVHFLVGNASVMTGQNHQAMIAYRQAIQLNPELKDAHCNLCHTLIDTGDLDGALEEVGRAIARWPDFTSLYRHLGRVHREAGRLDEAVAGYRAGLEHGDDMQLHSDLLFMLNFHPGYDRRRLFEEHRKWEEKYALPQAHKARPAENVPWPERRLRVGYVSHDLGNHPLGRFMVPLLTHHDRRNFEVYMYCEFLRGGTTSDRLKAAADVWRPLRGVGEDAVAQLIREDRIDILVDVNMHANGCRLSMFAQKPAPVQVSYLAYCGTTGVRAVGYRLTDRFLDPPGPSTDLGEGPLDRDTYYAEKSVRLPGCYWCYPEPDEAPEVGVLPAKINGHVTFGCLNEFTKVGPGVLDVWAGLLNGVPTSRLLMHAKFGGHRSRVLEHMARFGIDASRLEFVNHVPMNEYFALYNRIDIALDPFPWAGGTTTLDALWMGVPVVTLAGDTGVSRGGLTIVSNLGHPEWAATSVEQYIEIAQRLAADVNELARVRSGLREAMRTSVLMDGPRFVAGVEDAYRQMWHEWCGRAVVATAR